MSAIDGLPPLRDVIARHDLRAKKQLGQNFLLDLNLTARIARAAGTTISGAKARLPSAAVGAIVPSSRSSGWPRWPISTLWTT